MAVRRARSRDAGVTIWPLVCAPGELRARATAAASRALAPTGVRATQSLARELAAAASRQTLTVQRHDPAIVPKRNAFYAQSGGVTAVINASAAGVIETARKHKRPHRQGLRRPQRHHRRADRGPDRHRPRDRARDRRADAHAGRRVRLVPLQAEGPRGESRAVRAADRRLPRARHRLLLLQRRQRLGRHLPQGVADRRASSAIR